MKRATRILSGISALILFFTLLATGLSCQQLPTSSAEVITITYDFPDPGIEEAWGAPFSKDASRATEGYVSVTIDGLLQWSEPGLPVLPFKTARILLPYGFDVEDITVTRGSKVALPGSYLVEPGQQAVRLSYEGPVEPTPPKLEVYDSSAPFPGKLYSDNAVQSKSGYRMLLVNLYPVEYIPALGHLSYYESLTVQVTLKAATQAGDEAQNVRPLGQDRELLREMADNPGAIKSYGAALSSFAESSLLDPGDYEYVIITSQALKDTPGPDNFQALRDEKVSRNITATIVTTEWIYANYSGTRPDGGEDNQTRIRNFIIDAYNTWGTRYVLLGGDGDGADVGGESGDDIIPPRGFAAYDDTNIPADMYYACLDGSFDYDADGIYGEPNDGLGGGEVDLFAEVYVGRAPVDSEAEVQNFVAKTLAYQATPITDENLRKVWMVGEYLGFGGVADWGGNYKDEIRDGSSAHGYTTVGFEDSSYAPGFDLSTLYDRDYSSNYWPPTEIIGIINDNAHFINHLGHANVGYAMKMSNSDVDGLTNDELYFIGYSQGCYCGSFDNRYDYGDYAGYDCISEHLTTQPHGAVAFIANSRYGWGTYSSTDGPSQHYDREFWDAVLGEDLRNIGIANQDSKEDNAGRVGDEIERWCYYEITLFGDPELALKLYEGVTYDSHEIDDSAGGDDDGYPEPGESISMPVTLRNTSTNTTFSDISATLNATTLVGTITFSEDFEGSWPGDWVVGDFEPTNGDDYWGQSDDRAYSGSFSGYCAEVSDVSGQYYDDYMDAFMVRDVDLGAYHSATLSYKYWLDCESYCDSLDVVYFDGVDYLVVKTYAGATGGWISDSVEVPSTATQVGFLFHSDYSVTYEGAYVDDVILTGHSRVVDPYITITDDYEEYGDILPGGNATSLDAYEFTIDAECPVGHMVTFGLNITASDGGPWADSFNLRIEGPDLVISDKWEEWVDEEAGNYTVHYVVKNMGNVTAPASHTTALTVDDVQIETKTVPVELGPGEEYVGAFDTIITLSEGIDEVMVCADVNDIIEELSEENNCRSNVVLLWIEFMTDLVGDQFYGYGPDIVGGDYQVDETDIYFRVRTDQPLDPDDTVNYKFLDLDLNASTGFVSPYPEIPTNDIGADALAIVYPAGSYGVNTKPWSLPLCAISDKRQVGANSPQALSVGLQGELLLWDPEYAGFYYAGDFSVFTDTDYFWFAIPLDMLGDDGLMSVVDVIGDYYESTDVAPNEGHGVTGEGPDLIIADQWEEWVNEEEGTYAVHYVVKNQGNTPVPANHTTALTVDDVQIETKTVPVELGPGEEYQGAFDTVITLSDDIDEVTACADIDNVIEELSEENNCRTSILVSWTEFITDPTGDQFYGYGSDIVGADFYLDDTGVYFRVKVAEPLEPSILNIMWLDLDLDDSTGYVSGYPEEPTNDIGADAAAFIYPPGYYGMMGEEWSLPLCAISDKRQVGANSPQALSVGLQGELLLWDPEYGGFYYAGDFSVFTDTDYFWFAIPLDMLGDDGLMNVVDVIGDYDWGLTDVAPNESHGTIGEYPTVTTQDATRITTASATLNMNYDLGDFTGVEVRFAYKHQAGTLWWYSGWESQSADGVYALLLAGLSSSTAYDFKAQLQYGSTVTEGVTLQFRTLSSGEGACFIATAAYGTPMAEEIHILREFRDEYLLTNPLGQALVDFYYRVSPPIADFITEHPSLRPIVRAGLLPAVAMSTVAVNTTTVDKAAIAGLLLLLCLAPVVWTVMRRRRDTEST
jgi:archaellum component FlaG (FlaF/FlaG flagellin family)